MDEQDVLTALVHLPSFGPVRLRKLLSVFPNAEQLWHASLDELVQHGVPFRWADRFVAERKSVDIAAAVGRCHDLRISIVTERDANYPELLRHIPDAPLVLFVRGTLEPAAPLTLAVVGTRKPSLYGRQVSRELGRMLGSAGVLVLSGLALGIDGLVHQAVVDGEGRTAAVVASGLDSVYPATHLRLARDIVGSGGALISEFPPGTLPLKHHFPIRNRILAGMASGTVVVEAPQRSGALLTANLALEYNRDVFAVPGPITSATSLGTNTLLQQGAVVVRAADDILTHYRMQQTTASPALPQLTSTERAVLHIMTREPLSVDQVKKMSRLETSVVNATLILLVMKGWVQQLDPLHFLRIR